MIERQKSLPWSDGKLHRIGGEINMKRMKTHEKIVALCAVLSLVFNVMFNVFKLFL